MRIAKAIMDAVRFCFRKYVVLNPTKTEVMKNINQIKFETRIKVLE